MGEGRINRRQLIAGAGMAATATVLLDGRAAAIPAADAMETDIVCVGSGAAAMTAAVTAVEAGCRVVVVEKLPILGGTTAKSGGVLWIPNNFALRDAGIADTKRDCMAYMARYAYPQRYVPTSATFGLDPVEYKLLEAFYDNAAPAIDMLRSAKAAHFSPFRMYQLDRPAPDYADHLPENKVPSGRCLVPVGGAQVLGGGALMIEQIEAWLRARKVPILTDTQVSALMIENGRVVGVDIETAGKTSRIRARRAVIFGSGGYAHNAELIRRHQPALAGTCATPGATGDFIPLASAVGAQMGPLGTAWRTQVLAEEAAANRSVGQGVFFVPGDSMILVNKYGRRVVNEKRNYNDRTEAHFVYDPTREEYPNQLLFMIFDERSRDSFGGSFPITETVAESPHLIEGRDLATLSRNIAKRLSALAPTFGAIRLSDRFEPTLAGTIEGFNRAARQGHDDEFLRGQHAYDREWHLLFSARRTGTKYPPNPMPNLTMHPLADKGPYYAFILAAGALDTSGGPLINERAQVIGADGRPIPGLYGAGNCVSSPTGRAYFGAGGTLGPAVAFGYLAARHAAQEAAA